MMYRCVLTAIALSLLSAAVGGEDTRPNVVILFADDLGYGDLGSYGGATESTPNLDQMALEGLRFLDFYAASPICSPSRASMLTGRYAGRLGVYPGVFHPDSIGGLPLDEITVAEYLQDANYSTAMVGKWHLGVGQNNIYMPTNHGFDHYTGIPYSHSDCPCNTAYCFHPDISCSSGCGGGNSDLVPCPVFEDSAIVEQPADYLTLDDRYDTAAVDFIATQAAAQTPFFLYYAIHHTHVPQYASENITDSSSGGIYNYSLAAMDRSVGLVLQALKDAGVDDNTFVFFASDNGPQSNTGEAYGSAGPLKCGKGTTYEGGMRVPGIAWWPGKISSGTTEEIGSTLDLLPTILNITGVTADSGIALDGYDMSPILFDNQPGNREVLYYFPVSPRSTGMFAMRYKQYKAHFYTKGAVLSADDYPDTDCRPTHTKTLQDPVLLFDLDQDIGESSTLTSSDAVYTPTLSEMQTIKSDFEASFQWRQSETKKGEDSSVMPCADPGCTPFPSCCVTT